jgi:hypothetical protein
MSGGAGAPISVRIDYVILGPRSGGVQFGGAAPDQMIGEVIVGGIAHELRGSTSYYPMAVDQPDYVQSNGLPSSARPLHIGRCAGCSSYESIRNVIPGIERERTTLALAALAQQLREADQWRPCRHAHAFLFLQRGLLESGEGGAPPTLRARASGAHRAHIGRALRRFLRPRGITARPLGSPSHRAPLAPTGERAALGCPSQQMEIPTWRVCAQRFWRRRRWD